MQAGIFYGFAGLVEYIVKKIKREMKCADVKVVATGGFSEIIAKEISCIDEVDKLLTLNGLNYLYNLNCTWAAAPIKYLPNTGKNISATTA